MNNNRKYNSGMTLIEVIVTISVFTFVLIILFSSIIFFYRTNKYSIDQAFAVESARKGVEDMVQSIREANYSDEGSFPVISAGENTFYFYSDNDGDNNVERIRYFLENNLFKKGITKSSGAPLTYIDINENVVTVSDNVRNIYHGLNIFTYYDKDGVEIIDLSRVLDITFIKIILIINADDNRQPNEFTLKSSATLRNLKTNL